MSTPLPPDLARLERALEASRAGLPAGLRARILGAAAQGRPLRPVSLSRAWFAAAVAAAAAVLLNLSGSASLASSEPDGTPADRCAIGRALHEAPELCRSAPQENP